MSAFSTSSLYLVLRARDEASRVIRGFTSTLTEADMAAAKLQAAQMRRGQSMATIGVVMAGAGIIGVMALNKMADAAMAYNQQASLTLTQVDGVNVSLAGLEAIGLRVGKALPVAFDKLQPTLYDIFSSINVNAPQAEKLLMAIGKASVAGSADMQTVGRATIAILNAYKMPITEVTKVSDVMFQLVRKGVGTYQEFTNVIGRIVPAGTKAGQSLQTITGMMAFLTRNGISAQNAVAPVSQALNGLSKPAVVKTLRDMGVQVIDASGKFRSMVDIIKDLKAKLDPLPNAIQALELSKILKGGGNAQAAMKFWVTALKDTNGLLPEMVTAMNNASGASDAAYKIMSNTPAAKIELMKNKFKELEIAVGSAVLPIKKDLAEAFSALFGWLTKLPKPMIDAVAIFAAIASVGLIVTGIIVALAGVIVILSSAWGILGDTMVGKALIGMRIFIVEGLMAMKSYLLEVLVVLDAFIARVAFFTLALIGNAARQVAAWLAVRAAAAAAATSTEVSITAQIAGWLALKAAAIADAAAIAFAWLMAGGPITIVVGIIVAAAAVIAGSMKLIGESVNKSHKTWTDWAKLFIGGGVVGIALGVISKSDIISPAQDAANVAKLRKLNGLAPILTPAEKDKAALNKMMADSKKASAAMEKMLADLLNPPKKPKASDSRAIIDQVTAHINTLKNLISSGAKDITKMASDVPGGAASLQKAINKLSLDTPNQLKALGVNGIQKLIDGLRSKEEDLKSAYNDVLYKTALQAYKAAEVLSVKGADAINGFISKMTGDLGKDVSTLKPITLKLGADVVDAFATGMNQTSPKARLAAYSSLEKSVESAYQGVLSQLEAVKQAVVDKMKIIHDAVSQSIMSVVNFSTAYQKALALSKTASDLLAASNAANLKKVEADYAKTLGILDTTLKNAQGSLTQTAGNISGAIVGALNFSNAASEANKFENTFMEQLKVQADKAKAFAVQIKELIRMGLSGDAINQVAAAGAEAGATIAKNIIDGGVQAITDTNDMVKSVTDLANTIGTSSASAYYAAGVTQAQAAVDGYVTQYGPDSPGRIAMIAAGNAAVTALANTMGETFAAAMANQGKAATAFADQIKQLIAMGLSGEALQQVIAAGTDAGSQIAASLITGGVTAINQTNSILSATQKMADDIGKNAADKFYGVGLINAQNMIDAFIANFGPKGAGRAALMTAMDDLANSMNRTATVTINTVNPGLLGGGGMPVPTPTPTPSPRNKNPLGGPYDTNGNHTTVPEPGSFIINVPTTSVQTADPQAYAAALGFYLAGKLIQ